jgi:D-mannonate dehydratase
VDTPRGYKAREFSVSDFQSKQRSSFRPGVSGQEIWDGFVYWLKAVLPVAEEANVKLAMHPDDPPVLKKMNGIGRIFTNEECYRRANRWRQEPSLGRASLRGDLGRGRRRDGERAFSK